MDHFDGTWPRGDGEMAGLVRAHDWAATSLGAIEGWPRVLRTAVDLMLAMPDPATVLWGAAHAQLYNDAYVAIARDRHPSLLGRSAAEGWPDVYDDVIAPLLAETAAGRAVRLTDYAVALSTSDGEQEERIFDTAWSPIRDEAGAVAGTLQTLMEVTESRRAQEGLRESEERQAFLLELSDALRPLADPSSIATTACRHLVERLDASRAQYTVVEGVVGEEVGEVRGEFIRVGQPMARRFLLSAYGEPLVAVLRSGQTLVLSDTDRDPRVADAQRDAFRAVESPAAVAVPLVKDGALVANLTVHSREPRDWLTREIALVENVAERTWAAVERARAEAALRESEARFAQFAASSSGALWIRDAATLTMEYVSPAIEAIYGVPPETLLGPVEHWTALIASEDRDAAREHLEQARSGEPVVHEFRIPRSAGGEERWIRNTDFPLLDEHGRVQRIGGIAEDITQAKQMQERQRVLVAELQHRTRNLLSVVRAMADKTMHHAAGLEDFRIRFDDRLAALARVQGLLSRLDEWDRVTFDALIRSELAVLDGEAARIALAGPEGVALRSSTVQTLALALHELTTNALKYGALAQPRGHIAITWRVERPTPDAAPWLHVEWRESGVRMPAEGSVPQGSGAGRELIERALPYQLGARTTYVMGEDGVRCTIALPVSERRAVRGMADV